MLLSRKKGGVGEQNLGVLCTTPFNSWKNAIEKFKLHEMKEYYKNCVMTVQTLKHNISTNFSINLLLDKSLKDKISLNKNL